MNPPYTQQQIGFALNWISNSPSSMHGTVQELEAYAKKVITEVFGNANVIALIGNWSLAWGPVVFQANGSTVADNAMYVARSQDDATQYVVAISGTNPISAFGWIVEDLMINPVVPWPYGSASPSVKGDITHGTSVGLDVLLNRMTDGDRTLFAFLAEQVSMSSEPLTITVTGHSLGGALSPATALALRDTQKISLGQPEGWDPNATATIQVLPTAGPTPGNSVWRDYYDERIGATTDRLWNNIDIVPHAWQLDMLAEIPSIYTPVIPANPLIELFTTLAEGNSKLAGDLEQICPSVAGLPGQVDGSITLTVANVIVMLETMQANKLLNKLANKLDWSAAQLALAKAFIDDLIKALNGQQPDASLGALPAIESESATMLESAGLLGQIESFLNFLIQAAYQHTSAYNQLLGTQAFADLVDAIKALQPSQK